MDPSGDQTSKQVKKFYNQAGNHPILLEESTQWDFFDEL